MTDSKTLWTPGQSEIEVPPVLSVIMTSFDRAEQHTGPKLSVARWQPEGFDYKELMWLAPKDIDTGEDLKHLEPSVFREKYENILDHWSWATREFFIATLGNLSVTQLTFCCWCNFRRQAKYEKLYCHTILLGWWLEEHIEGVEVIYLEGRDRPVWDRRLSQEA